MTPLNPYVRHGCSLPSQAPFEKTMACTGPMSSLFRWTASASPVLPASSSPVCPERQAERVEDKDRARGIDLR